jgi:hypothetical protein
MASLGEVIGAPIHDPVDVYGGQQEASFVAAEQALGVRIDRSALLARQNETALLAR